MFAWVGSQFESVLNTYAIGVVTSLMAALAPVALTSMTLWVGLYGWAVLRNEVSDTVPAFVWRMFKVGLVLAIALQSGLYISTVSDTANALATGVATSFLPASADAITVSGPYSLLDRFNDKASKLTLDLLTEAGFTRVDLWFAAAFTAIGNVVFLCLALYIITLAKVLLTFTIAVGPIFVLSLAWRPTAKFFDSWLSMLLNAVVLSWIAFFALGLSIHMGLTIVQAIQDEGGITSPSFNPVGESLKYCIVMTLMAILCFQAPSLASGLTGGPAVQQGVQMIQNVLMASRRGSQGGGYSAAARAQGGVARTASGIPYAAGRATGAAAAATGRVAKLAASHAAAGAREAVRLGAAGIRIAAYKLAALRGRT